MVLLPRSTVDPPRYAAIVRCLAIRRPANRTYVTKRQVLEVLRAEGLLGEGAGIEETVIALHRHLARTPSMLLGVSLVDCVGERRIQNQPGTDEEYPNWRIPLADAEGETVSIDDIASDQRTARLLAAVREGISSR